MSTAFEDIFSGLRDGSVVPYLGPGALSGVTDANGKAIPADSDSLILAMNNGQPMAPKLMYEFPRAAMNVELKRGRNAVNKFLDATYKDTQWSTSPLHAWLGAQKLPYMIDANRDTQMQLQYAGTPHTLVVGIARMAGTAFRFKLFHYDGSSYTAVEQEAVDSSLPILFKPLGTPTPESSYIASDADFVDYITELMGGFAIPSFIKRSRQNKRYVTLGLRLNRDTDRMVFSDVIFGADKPAGWALIPHPTDKEKRYLDRLNIEIVSADVSDFLSAAQGAGAALEAA
ncbi:MAG: SIR2 family protein [Sideroxydans sp.]|nr:SIR2 family protein [Sideroxydans sp.]